MPFYITQRSGNNMVKINVTEKQVFFALCKAMRRKQDLKVNVKEGSAVESYEVCTFLYEITKSEAFGKDVNEKQVWALLHKMIKEELVVKKVIKKKVRWSNRRGKWSHRWVDKTFFELGTKGKEYINTLRGK
jgi:hypothetical protein